MLLDSNIIIYAAQPPHHALRQFIAAHAPAVSAVSYVEVLGYHGLQAQERLFLEQFFQAAQVLPIDQAVLDEAVQLRQQRRMSLGAALIAGTALVHGLRLATRNTADFVWIAGLDVFDPLVP